MTINQNRIVRSGLRGDERLITSDIQIFGAAEYAMRVWLDPDLTQSFDMTAGDVLRALRSQNIQVAGGTLNQPPFLMRFTKKCIVL